MAGWGLGASCDASKPVLDLPTPLIVPRFQPGAGGCIDPRAAVTMRYGWALGGTPYYYSAGTYTLSGVKGDISPPPSPPPQPPFLLGLAAMEMCQLSKMPGYHYALKVSILDYTGLF